MTSTSAGSSPASVTGPAILFVCTGNVCRSPFAELLLRSRVPGVRVASRGIYALEGEGMEHQMAAELATRGISSDGFRAQQVSNADLQADLILTMSRRQRAYLLEENPAVGRRVGLLGHVPQLAQLAEAEGGLSPDVITQWARHAQPAGHEVQDPYRRPREIAAAAAQHIDELVSVLEGLLAAYS